MLSNVLVQHSYCSLFFEFVFKKYFRNILNFDGIPGSTYICFLLSGEVTNGHYAEVQESTCEKQNNIIDSTPNASQPLLSGTQPGLSPRNQLASTECKPGSEELNITSSPFGSSKTDACIPMDGLQHLNSDEPVQGATETNKLLLIEDGHTGDGADQEGQRGAVAGENGAEEETTEKLGRFIPELGAKKRKRRIAFRIILLVAVVALIAMLIFSAVAPPSLPKFDIGIITVHIVFFILDNV